MPYNFSSKLDSVISEICFISPLSDTFRWAPNLELQKLKEHSWVSVDVQNLSHSAGNIVDAQ